MSHQEPRQLTPYETRIYFVSDREFLDQQGKIKAQIDAVTACLDELNEQLEDTYAMKSAGKSVVIISSIGILAYIISAFIYFHMIFTKDSYRYIQFYLFIELLYIISIFLTGFFGKKLVDKDNIPDGALAASFIFPFVQIISLFIGIKSIRTANKGREEYPEELQQQEQELQALQEQEQELQQKQTQLAPPPTDQEFDAWLENKVRESLAGTLRKLGLEEEITNQRQLLHVRGYILPGIKDAHHYNPEDLRYKLGADGRRRYSVNIYTYFYPAEHQIMIFTYVINAMNWNDYRETTNEYFYQDVINVRSVDDYDDKFSVEGKSYRTQRFSLSFRDGQTISAAVRSQPIDAIDDLPVFDIPQSDIDKTVAQLRLLLREKKA